ncbi:MAG: SCO family protein [Hyphomicrobiaceae bacterium]
MVNEHRRQADLTAVTPSQKFPAKPGPGRIGATFDLIDQTGKRRTSAGFTGRKMLMIFAALSEKPQTFAALQVLNSARELIGPAAQNIAFVWITTDPVNDTPNRLATALARTGGEWTALTGTTKAIDDLAASYFVPAVLARRTINKAATKGAPPVLATIAYLIDENGAFISHRTLPPDPAAVAQWLLQAH